MLFTTSWTAIARVAPALLDCYDLLMFPTIFRHGAFQIFLLFTRRAAYAVHVAHTDGEAKFWLEPEIALAMNQGLSKKQLHEASLLVQDHYEEITDAWHRHF